MKTVDWLIVATVVATLSIVGCTEYPTRQLQEVKVVGHNAYRQEGSGITGKIVYEHWVYENTTTKERFTLMDKYGEIGDIIKIRR